MAKFSYSYLPFDQINPHTNQKIGEFFRPIIPIRVQSQHGPLSQPIDALVDSGADRNLFPLVIATNMLGIKIKRSEKKIITGIGDKQITAYPAKFKIWISNQCFETEADFSSEQKGLLLGREGFFSFFKSVNFRHSDHFIDFETFNSRL